MRVRSVSSTAASHASGVFVESAVHGTVKRHQRPLFASSYVTSVLIVVRLTYVHLQGPSTSNFTKRA
jgi:hypothetical protein